MTITTPRWADLVVGYGLVAATLLGGGFMAGRHGASGCVAPAPAPPPGPTPNPGPPPVPPPPAPKPADKTFWVVVVEAEAGPDADAAALTGDSVYWAGLALRGHGFRVYRPGSREVADKGYLKYAQEVGLPAALLVEREAGRPPAAAFRLPKTAAELDQRIKAAGGK